MNLTWTITLLLLCTAAALTAGLVTGYAWGASERRGEQEWESIADASAGNANWPGKAGGSPGLTSGNGDGRTRYASQETGDHAGLDGLSEAIAELPRLSRWIGDEFDRMVATLRAGERP